MGKIKNWHEQFQEKKGLSTKFVDNPFEKCAEVNIDGPKLLVRRKLARC